MRLLLSMLLVLIAITLSACVSEEGARKHTAREDAVAAKVESMTGMMWRAVVYSTDSDEDVELGYFQSRDECYEDIQVYIAKQPSKNGHLASACAIAEPSR